MIKKIINLLNELNKCFYIYKNKKIMKKENKNENIIVIFNLEDSEVKKNAKEVKIWRTSLSNI